MALNDFEGENRQTAQQALEDVERWMLSFSGASEEYLVALRQRLSGWAMKINNELSKRDAQHDRFSKFAEKSLLNDDELESHLSKE